MKLIIAGGRNYKFNMKDRYDLYAMHTQIGISEVVSGGASGADKEGEDFAKRESIPIRQFPADWEKHGKAAGPIRNRQMAEYADAVILFTGGRGTQSMHDEAVKAGIIIYDNR